MLASLDFLGENVVTVEQAANARDSYLRALMAIASANLSSTVSVKLSALGIDISDVVCRSNLSAVVSAAEQIQTRVEIDMEASPYVERTLRLVHDMHQQYASVRAVIQAYLYRSEDDIAQLCESRIPVRLCKGAYREPASVAYPRKAEVDENYIKLMKHLLHHGTDPAIATHDETIVEMALRHAKQHGIAADSFEFQMLYGVRRSLQKQVVREGYRLRVYTPYGEAWYPYFMRRLAERPANVLFLLRSVIRN